MENPKLFYYAKVLENVTKDSMKMLNISIDHRDYMLMEMLKPVYLGSIIYLTC